ncbi:MAG: reverse transcriptase domain-containing protein [Microvirga sp.]
MDGLTWQDYEANLEANLQDLHRRVHRGSYRAKPVRRRFIPKPDGRQRPLGVTALEDKILQRALVRVLNAIYEEDFLGFSYGFRPGRSQHHALDALSVGINAMRVNWILDADISGCFDHASYCPPQQANRGTGERRSTLPALSFWKARKVVGPSGNR